MLLLVILACDCNVWAVHIKFARMRSNRARQARTALRHQFMRKFPRLKCRRHSSTFFVSFSSAFDDVRARARARREESHLKRISLHWGRAAQRILTKLANIVRTLHVNRENRIKCDDRRRLLTSAEREGEVFAYTEKKNLALLNMREREFSLFASGGKFNRLLRPPDQCCKFPTSILYVRDILLHNACTHTDWRKPSTKKWVRTLKDYHLLTEPRKTCCVHYNDNYNAKKHSNTAMRTFSYNNMQMMQTYARAWV